MSDCSSELSLVSKLQKLASGMGIERLPQYYGSAEEREGYVVEHKHPQFLELSWGAVYGIRGCGRRHGEEAIDIVGNQSVV